MTATAIFCFAAIVLAASLRAFGPRRSTGAARRRRRSGAGLALGEPVPTLDLVGGERRPGASGIPFRHAGPGGSQRGSGRFGD